MNDKRCGKYLAAAGLALTMLATGNTNAASADTTPPGRTIAYAFTAISWGIYATKDAKEECPNGLNAMGPREQFKALFPDDGTERKLTDTQLAREAEIWWPDTSPDPYPIPSASGKIAIGLDLDGKTKPTDFTSPDGKPGVDNQLFRALGCVQNYRPGGPLFSYDIAYSKNNPNARILIELTDVDSLVNDDEVTVTTYRGRDQLVTDATGANYYPGGTQRIDIRYGKAFIHHAKGKIVNGVLITEPMDFVWPSYSNKEQWMRDARFELTLTPEKAKGLIGGYADIDAFHYVRIRNWATHFHAYGQQAQASTYKALKKFADAYPDPTTGENTAISASYTADAVQVHLLHPDKQLSEFNGSRTTQIADNMETEPRR